MSAKRVQKNTKIEELREEQRSHTSTSGLHHFIIIFSVAWFAIVAIYITKFFGWDNLFSMLPNEFSGFMAGITLPLAIIWVIMAYIDRGNSYHRESEMLQNSINQVIFPDSGANNVTKMIADAIQKQVIDLREATRDVYAQSDVIRRDLGERINDMRALSEDIKKYSKQSLPTLSEEIRNLTLNFQQVAEKASTTTADFRVNTLQIREDSENLANMLTPMVNQMVTAAEHVKEVVNVNNENIAHAQEQLEKYAKTSRDAISQIIESWAEKGENLERTFLRTAENCDDMFHRLDSGISHIENSIAEQKKVVEAQSELLNQNSGYLENKLGEYGKLISLEVEAMVERSGKLENNVQTQMANLRETSEQISDLFAKVGDGIVAKRQMLEIEGSQMVKNINATIERLQEEMRALNEYYDSTQSRNGDMDKVFASVASNLQKIEGDLNASLLTFNAKADEIAGKFNGVGEKIIQGLNQSFADIDAKTASFAENVINKLNDFSSNISDNISKMATNSDSMAEQSKINASLLIEQDEYINKSLISLKQITGRISTANEELKNTGNQIGNTLNSYEEKMVGFNQTFNRHLEDLNSNYDKAKKQLDELDQKYKTASIDTFMKNSADIISELEALSIDVHGIFNKLGKDDDLWRQYYAGDHGIFVRYLSNNMTKNEIAAIRKDYESKPDFRVVVDKYIDDFNSLIAAARKNNRAGTLLALISGSDIGKVYYVLARALGKLN